MGRAENTPTPAQCWDGGFFYTRQRLPIWEERGLVFAGELARCSLRGTLHSGMGALHSGGWLCHAMLFPLISWISGRGRHAKLVELGTANIPNILRDSAHLSPGGEGRWGLHASALPFATTQNKPGRHFGRWHAYVARWETGRRMWQTRFG